MIRGALFDMDGLLLDSEGVYARGIREVMGSLGFTISDDALRRALGVNQQVSNAIFAEGNPGYDGPRMHRVLGDWLAAHGYDRRIPLKPGAAEVLPRLAARGVRCALVTSSPLSQAQTYLGGAGLMGYFSAVVTGDLKLPSKPAPDVFLYAAGMLALNIRDCAVLEDSLNGLKAGRAAGAVTVMIPDLIPYGPETAPYCDHVFHDLTEAEAALWP